jgi:hypothetical protein
MPPRSVWKPARRATADALAASLAAGLDTVIRPIEGGIRTVAHQLEEVDPPPEQYPLRIHGILNAWPEVYGSTIAAEVSAGNGRHGIAPYFFRRGGAIAYSDLALDSYGYSRLPWYRRAADARQAVWSAPYFDAGGGETWMITYSVPFFRPGRRGARARGRRDRRPGPRLGARQRGAHPPAAVHRGLVVVAARSARIRHGHRSIRHARCDPLPRRRRPAAGARPDLRLRAAR